LELVRDDWSRAASPPTLSAAIVSPGFTASNRVAFEPWGDPFSIAVFFENLALHWRGWEGVRSWDADDVSMSLACEHDGVGSIRIQVVLRSLDWEAHGSISLEPGLLSEVAQQLRRLIAETTASDSE